MKHAGVLFEMFLAEDSRGSMMRLLKMARPWADFFQEAGGQYPFEVANWFATVARLSGQSGVLMAKPALPILRGDEMDHIVPYLRGQGGHDVRQVALTAMLRSVPYGSMRYSPHDPFDPINSALEALGINPRLQKLLSTPFPDAEQLGREAGEAQMIKADRHDVSALGHEFLRLQNGFVWKQVSDDEFCGFAGPLRNCGEGTGDQLFVLVDPRGRPHVVASWDEATNSFDQIAGKANSVPNEKFKPMIDALISAKGGRLKRGEKSFGSSFEDH